MKKKWLVVVLSVLSVLAALAAFAACNSTSGTVYGTPDNIAYDGQCITWSKAQVAVIGKAADYYNVTINGGEKQRSNSTTYSYASTDTFEVTVAAVFDGKERTSASVTFKPLAPIEEVFVADDGSLSWNAVAGANAYSLTVNGQAATTTDTHYALSAGSNRVMVKPIVSGDPTFYSSWSKEVSATVYSAPANIRYDGTALSWTGNAVEYLVTVNGVPMSETVRGNSCLFSSENSDFTVEVKAVGNHTTTYDSAAVSEEFYYLDPVTDLVIEDGILKWTAIAGAEGYKIKIGSVEQREILTQPEYTKLTPGKSLDVSVIPVNNSGNYFSAWSGVKTVYILEAPVLQWNNDLELDGDANNNITWNAVSAAGGYTVRLMKDGVVQKTEAISGGQVSFAEAYRDVGVYTVEVKANAESENYYDSKYSASITVERLAAPRAATQNYILSDPDNLAAGFTVNFIGVNGASGYQLYKDGVLLNGKYTAKNAALTDTGVVESSNMSEQNYTYMVRSMGGRKKVSGRDYITLPCLSESALSFNIKVQATPQNPEMSGYDLTWDSMAGTNGYTVSYGGTNVTASAEHLNLKTLKAGSYSVTVHARGNGSNVLASNRSTPVAIKRLEAPTNIRITSEDGGTLQWDHDTDISGYSVFLGSSQTALEIKSYNDMYQFIDTNGTTLSMVAVANKYNEDHTLYYMSSENSPTQQFIRLAAPVFPEGAVSNSAELLWNVPGNINTSEYTPTYRLYSDSNGSVLINGGQLNGTRYNIEYLEGGQEYSFYVKAIGNDTKYLDSELSVVKKVFKLETPEIRIQDGCYVWAGISHATSYIMTIDGAKASDEFHIEGNAYSFVPRYTTPGEHIVTLQAVGDGREYLDSKEYRLVQKAKVLQSPIISYQYSADAVVKGGTIDVTVTTPSPNAKGYQYEVGGVSATSSQLTYKKVVDATGTFSIRVKALGGSFDENDVYYIDSPYTGGTSADRIVLLGTPNYDKFEFYYGQFRWGTVSGAFGYDYQIAYDDEDYGEQILHTSQSMIDPIKNYTSHRKIKIRVRAKGGNNGKTVTSEWIEFTWTNPNS